MKKHSLLYRVSTISTIGVSILMLIFLGVLFFSEKVEAHVPQEGQAAISIVPDSERYLEDTDAPCGVHKEYILSVPQDLNRDSYLVFYSLHHYADVFLGEELLYSLQPGSNHRIGKTLGCNWITVPLYREYAGRDLTIIITPVYDSFLDWTPDFILGEQYKIYVNLLKQHMPQLVLAAMTFFAGIILLCLALYNHFVLKRFVSLTRLGLFSFLMGLWELSDIPLAPFLFPRQSIFLFYTSLAVLMLGFIPMMRFMSTKLSPSGSRMLDIAATATALAALLQLVLQVFGIVDMREILILTHLFIVLDAFCMLSNVLYDHFHYPRKSSILRSRHLYALCVIGILLDLLIFVIRRSSVGLFFSLIAFLFYIIFTALILLLDYTEQVRRMKDQELELMENRLAITLSQIRPHFIYNSLGAIRELCRQDPEEAREAITAFTAYLRGNMETLQSAKLIHFSKELSHIETYLKLEQLRFGDSLKIHYDLQENDFFLPALTVQPLVENAVKHGICAREEGGTLLLSTRREGENVLIRVQDDGVGFAAEAPVGSEHIGISNVRSRLEQQANGTLTIESAPGHGTTATVILPQ